MFFRDHASDTYDEGGPAAPSAELSPENQQRIAAAEGWLELGDSIEAATELNQVSPVHHDHPAVLTLRWRMFAKAHDWKAACEVAETLSVLVPQIVEPQLLLAEAVRSVPNGGLPKALQLLVDAAPRFQHEPVIPFTIARYACTLRRFKEAHRWWMTALTIAKQQGTDREWKRKALLEEDLQPLWREDVLP